jgi:uncharacterized membrane protein
MSKNLNISSIFMKGVAAFATGFDDFWADFLNLFFNSN